MSSGWLLLAWVPFAYSIGRGLGNSVFIIFFFYALFSLRRTDINWKPALSTLYLLFLAAFFLSVPGAVSVSDALQGWLKVVLWSSSFFLVLIALRQGEFRWRRLATWFGVAAFLAGGNFLGELALVYWQGGYVAGTVSGLVASYLFPFGLNLLLERGVNTKSIIGASLYSVVLMAGLLLADSSTEVLVAGAGLVVYLSLVARRRLLLVLGLMAVVTLTLGSELYPKLSSMEGQSLRQVMSLLSSYRTELWLGALEHPPENQWIGVGLRNTAHYAVVKTVGVKSLHNFVIATWYETGVIGLVALLAFLSYVGGRPGAWLASCATLLHRQEAAPWVAGIVGVLIANSLDGAAKTFSFSCVLFVCLAVLWHMRESAIAVQGEEGGSRSASRLAQRA
ncbi:MAG: O-antigen ligase family protein [Sedimenticola sp.]